MKKKRMLALLLTVAMAGTMLAGCGSSDGRKTKKEKIRQRVKERCTI